MTHSARCQTAVSAIVSVVLCSALAAQAQTATKQKQAEQKQVEQKPDRAAAPRMTPERVADAIEDELSHDPVASLADVDVQVKNGVATLSGQVDSLLARERAARIALTVKGALIVVNEITVRPRMHITADELRSTIHQALLMNPATDAFQVQVAAEPDGSVRLTGNVESWAERDLAGRIAKGVSGVTAVENYIDVNYSRNRPDSEIAADVERLLRWDVYLDDSDIDVAVNNGTVALSGVVKSAAEKVRAINLAWLAGTQGVQVDNLQVVNDGRSDGMKKQQPADVSDGAIATAVRNRLELNPYVDSSNV